MRTDTGRIKVQDNQGDLLIEVNRLNKMQ
jgi:hypothetical protein